MPKPVLYTWCTGVQNCTVQRFSAKYWPLPVGGVHHQEDELRVGVVGVPGGPQRLLAPQVPHDEVDVVPDHLNTWGQLNWLTDTMTACMTAGSLSLQA